MLPPVATALGPTCTVQAAGPQDSLADGLLRGSGLWLLSGIARHGVLTASCAGWDGPAPG